jgi:hypothetical protein
VRHTWKRFCGWYGADAIERKFGLQAPDDWRDSIDSVNEKTLESAMTQIRQRFPTWPPSLPEFEQIVRDLRKSADNRGPTTLELLTDYVLRTKSLSKNQASSPWTYIGTGNARTGEGFAITGVVIPADGSNPGYRVMVADMGCV